MELRKSVLQKAAIFKHLQEEINQSTLFKDLDVKRVQNLEMLKLDYLI